MEEKRLFFGLETEAPWPRKLPAGRILDEKHRHITLAFLGNTDFSQLMENLTAFPSPPFKVGFVGKFDQCLFLPKRHPRVVAWHVDLLESPLLLPFQQTLSLWLSERGYPIREHHPFTPHVTLARAPFAFNKWKREFAPLPLMTKSLHLYESVGNLVYTPLWTLPLLAPFEELDHTADIAFRIRGDSLTALFQHAAIALAFPCPKVLPFIMEPSALESIEDVIIALNAIVSQADKEIGTPYKAVSFHGDVDKKEGILTWEMIIDV